MNELRLKVYEFICRYPIIYKLFFAVYKLYYSIFELFYSKTIIVNLNGKSTRVKRINCNYHGHNVSIIGYRFRETFLPIKEIFFKKEYDYLNVKGIKVVDIGGFDGDSAISFAIRGASKVYVYEANPNLMPLIKYNINANGFNGKILAFNSLVDPKSGSASNVYIDDQNMVNSAKVNQRYKIKEKLNKTTLNNIVKYNSIRGGALKMDVEGAEYKIIGSASISALKSFKQIQIDYHRLGDKLIVDKLSKAGFKCTTTLMVRNGVNESGYICAERR